MELKILDMIQQLRTPFGDWLMPLITRLDNYGFIWILLALVLLVRPRTRKAGFAIGIALLLDLLFCNCILKPLVGRVRPYDVNTAVRLLISRPTDSAFPSGHTASSFAAATALLFMGRRKLGWPAVVLAALIGFSRLYLYVHYPTDVLAGVLLGVVCGYLASRTVHTLEKLPGRHLPF